MKKIKLTLPKPSVAKSKRRSSARHHGGRRRVTTLHKTKLTAQPAGIAAAPRPTAGMARHAPRPHAAHPDFAKQNRLTVPKAPTKTRRAPSGHRAKRATHAGQRRPATHKKQPSAFDPFKGTPAGQSAKAPPGGTEPPTPDPAPGTYGAPPITAHGQAVPAYGHKPPTQPGAAVRVKHKLPAATMSQPMPILAPTSTSQAMHTIQGMQATDIEWRIYQALKKLHWPDSEIRFQVDAFGNTAHLPNTVLLNFVVFTPGAFTIIEPSADFFSPGAPQLIERNKVRIAAVQNATRQPFRYLPLSAGQLVDDATALNHLKLSVGRY